MMKIISLIFVSFILFTCDSEADSFVRNVEDALLASNQVKLSTLVDFDEICVFSQDDSDDHIALDDMKAYLQQGNIQLLNEDDLTKNPDNIILFIKEKKGWVYLDQRFRVHGDRYSFNGYVYEAIRQTCSSSEDAIITFFNNRLKVGPQ